VPQAACTLKLHDKFADDEDDLPLPPGQLEHGEHHVQPRTNFSWSWVGNTMKDKKSQATPWRSNALGAQLLLIMTRVFLYHRFTN
jgi:hypothetical protein